MFLLRTQWFRGLGNLTKVIDRSKRPVIPTHSSLTLIIAPRPPAAVPGEKK